MLVIAFDKWNTPLPQQLQAWTETYKSNLYTKYWDHKQK